MESKVFYYTTQYPASVVHMIEIGKRQATKQKDLQKSKAELHKYCI